MTGNDPVVAARWSIFTVALTAVCIRLLRARRRHVFTAERAGFPAPAPDLGPGDQGRTLLAFRHPGRLS
jgi:hypothetical protein